MNGNVCALCGSIDAEHFETVVDNTFDITFIMCTTCGLVRQWPKLSEEEVAWFNNNLYRNGRLNSSIEECEKRRAEAQFHLLSRDVKSPKAMLDVGCGSGELLSRFREYWPSLETWGIEPIDSLRAIASKKGHRLFQETWQIPAYGPFNLITMSHVLEHLPYPARTLYTLRARCAKSGLLYVEVPNLFGDVALEKAHLHAFTEDTLLAFMRSAGWDPIWLKKHGAPKHHSLEAYLSVLARPSPDFPTIHLPSPGMVSRRRRMGQLKRMWTLAICSAENDVDSTCGVW